MPILTTATKQIPTTEGALIKRGKKGFRGTPGALMLALKMISVRNS